MLRRLTDKKLTSVTDSLLERLLRLHTKTNPEKYLTDGRLVHNSYYYITEPFLLNQVMLGFFFLTCIYPKSSTCNAVLLWPLGVAPASLLYLQWGGGELREVTPDETDNPVEHDRGVTKPAPCTEIESRIPASRSQSTWRQRRLDEEPSR